jgi:hypothetical protein
MVIPGTGIIYSTELKGEKYERSIRSKNLSELCTLPLHLAWKRGKFYLPNTCYETDRSGRGDWITTSIDQIITGGNFETALFAIDKVEKIDRWVRKPTLR